MSAPTETPKLLLRAELKARAEEAALLNDWPRLEFWAKQWIETDPQNSEGFRWLARATLAQKQIARAAYSYGRLLDFDATDAEAKRFFAQYPSSQVDQNKSEVNLATKKLVPTQEMGEALSPEDRAQLAQAELRVAELYFGKKMYAEAGPAYKRSFDLEAAEEAALGFARSLHLVFKSSEATRFLREQLFHTSTWVEGRLLLGRILYEQGQKTEAQQEWQTVLSIDPKSEVALNFLRSLFLEAR